MQPSTDFPVRDVRAVYCGDGIRIIGTGKWADFGDAWMMAHDLLHHEPADYGTPEQELQTFGVEQWLERGKGSKPANSWRAVGQQLLAIWETADAGAPRRPQLAAAELHPAWEYPCGLREGFLEAARIGMEFLWECYEGRRGARKEQFLGAEVLNTLVSWMLLGYHKAQQRYPDHEAAYTLFSNLHGFFAHFEHGAEPRTLRFQLDYQNLTLVPLCRASRKAWQDVSTKAP
jgi:hypothetical protein